LNKGALYVLKMQTPAHLHADVTISFQLNKMAQLGKLSGKSKEHIIAQPQNAQLRHELHTSETMRSIRWWQRRGETTHVLTYNTYVQQSPRNYSKLVGGQVQTCEVQQPAAPSPELVDSKLCAARDSLRQKAPEEGPIN
jgi:hypothetical protein